MLELKKIISMESYPYLLIDLTNEEINYLTNIKEELKNINNINGTIILSNSDHALVQVTCYNSDLSLCEVSGNALINVIHYLFNNNKIASNNFFIETTSGLKEIDLSINNGFLESVTINMGKPSLEPRKIPVNCEKNIFINENIIMGNEIFNATSLSMGNPHTVIISKDIDKINLKEIGPKIEFYPIFPNRTNVEFVEVLKEGFVYNRIWERGNKEVSSCVTGACASVVALTLNSYLKQNQDIKVISNGGILTVKYKSNDDIIVTSSLQSMCKRKIK